MKKLNGRAGRSLVAIVAALVVAAPGLSQAAGKLTALARLEPGLWQLRNLDDRRALPSICIGDPNLLMQVQHRNSPCSRLVISNADRGATVQYTCPAGGFGRTSIRVETPRLAQIDTQGIVDNTPFGYRAEARRVGPCGGGGDRSGR
ncbi:MAG TPA: hypothetical protein VF662_04555 [Allosphingosinicella sp.]|jgi:hypothetical protein